MIVDLLLVPDKSYAFLLRNDKVYRATYVRHEGAGSWLVFSVAGKEMRVREEYVVAITDVVNSNVLQGEL